MKIDADKELLKKLQQELTAYKSQFGNLPEALNKIHQNLQTASSIDNPAELIKLQVYNTLSFLSGVEVAKIKPNQHLKFDLGLNQTEKWILKRKFNEILQGFGSQKSVTREECNKLKYVSDCTKLVNSKIS